MTISFGLPVTVYLGGSIGLAVSDSQVVKDKLNLLTEQAADGLVSDSFSGLGNGMATALALPSAINNLTTWQNNINASSGPMQVQQTALSQISSIASNFRAQLATLNGFNSASLSTFTANARDALRQVAGLLDSTDGGRYVFAGQDSANAPVPDPDDINSSGFATQIAASVAGLGANGASATIAATLAVGASNVAGTSPFSANLSQSATAVNALRTTVQTGASSNTVTGIMASGNSDATSAGTASTGSYMRDIMSSLATLGAISDGTESASGFQTLINNVNTVLTGAITSLNEDAGVLGNRQSELTTQGTALAQTQTALEAQLSNAQNVDTAATLTKLSATQTQLQASYQIIAGLQSLSLTRFIGSGG